MVSGLELVSLRVCPEPHLCWSTRKTQPLRGGSYEVGGELREQIVSREMLTTSLRLVSHRQWPGYGAARCEGRVRANGVPSLSCHTLPRYPEACLWSRASPSLPTNTTAAVRTTTITTIRYVPPPTLPNH
ncbi:hypothetical protein E2C01_059877 [Portunus trituberculatus]|uniref:Uncharacterized protein n=1 Tax=Portunus trituberculatus TaxID=210409 RepID=A0A5B7GZL8_PORTR|nr:hypothetical protein [Portunus trituberculatus]